MSNLTYPRLTENQGQINSASFLTPEQESFVVNSYNDKYNFNSVDDVIEISAYDISNGSLLSWGVFSSSVDSVVNNNIYTDLDGNVINYSFTRNSTEYAVIRGLKQKSDLLPNELILDPQSDVEFLGLPNASYNLVYTLATNLAGDVNNKLRILETSPSKTEVKAVLNPNTSDSSKRRFQSFLTGNPIAEEIIPTILEKIGNFQLSGEYFKAKDKDESTVEALKFFYSLKTDIDVINFLNKLYIFIDNDKRFSIYYQFQNFLYSKYNTLVSFKEIKAEYDDIVRTIIENQLTRITTSRLYNYDNIFNFIKSIFDSIFLIPVDAVEQEFNRSRNKFLNVFVNFGDNDLRMILNWKQDPNNEDGIILKLKDALSPNDKSEFYISRLVRDPIVLKTSLYSIVDVELNSLSKPNFNINVTSKETKTLSNEELTRNKSVEIKRVIEDSKNTIDVDYTKFENFVIFSSAETRLKNFTNKLNSIADLNQMILLKESQDVDSYQLVEINSLKTDVESVISGFDGYENFLYENPDWVTKHSEISSGGISSASYYDEFNGNSLRNSLPDYITEDINNDEFIHFCDAVGQAFDEIFTHVNLMTQNKRVEHKSELGMSDDVVNKMLSMLGWGTSGSEDEDLFINLFGEDPLGNKPEVLSAKERRNIIWRRMLNNLPYLLKTKGTVECIRALFNIYGIPRSLYSIKEYSSIPNNSDQKNLYIFDNDYYAVHFSGSNEYFESAWNSNVKSVEFKFSFDPDKIHDDGDVFRLVGRDSDWVVGAVRDKLNKDLGKVFFTLSETTSSESNIKTLITDTIPIFNGSVYSVLLRRNDISDDIILNKNVNVCGEEDIILTESELDLIPTRYDLVVKKATDDRISTETSASFFFSQDYNTTFRNGDYNKFYVGNFAQIESSYLPDPNAFYGTIDQVKLYNKPISDSRFDSHVFYVDAYDIDDSTTLRDSLLLHLKFNSPQDLHGETSSIFNVVTSGSQFLYSGSALVTSGSDTPSYGFNYVEVENEAFNTSSIPTVRAYNFPKLKNVVDVDCDFDGCCEEIPNVLSYIDQGFPWHFKKFQTEEYVRVPNFGGSSFKNNRIFYDDSYFSGSLYLDVKSNNPVDRSIDLGNPSIGVFFSPTDIENKEILKFFGDFNIGEFLGDPRNLYERQYTKFNKFKKVFYDSFSGVSFHDYITFVKNYVDKSVFSNLEKMMPARSKLKSGILIEPSILERNKVQYRPITVETVQQESKIDVIKSTNGQAFFGVTKDGSADWSDEIAVETGRNESRPMNINNGFFPDLLDPALFSIYSNRGVVRNDGKKYLAEVYEDVVTIGGDRNYIPQDSTPYWIKSTTIYRLNLIPLPDVFEPSTTVTASSDNPIYIDVDSFSGRVLFPVGSSYITGSEISGSSDEFFGVVHKSGSTFGTVSASVDIPLSSLYSLKINQGSIFTGLLDSNSYDVNSPTIQYSSGSLTGYLTEGSITYTVLADSLETVRDAFETSLPHENSRIFSGYSRQHRRNQRQILNKLSEQSIGTTIDPESRLLNGSSPVEGNGIDRGVINVETEGEGTILKGDS